MFTKCARPIPPAHITAHTGVHCHRRCRVNFIPKHRHGHTAVILARGLRDKSNVYVFIYAEKCIIKIRYSHRAAARVRGRWDTETVKRGDSITAATRGHHSTIRTHRNAHTIITTITTTHRRRRTKETRSNATAAYEK